MTGNKSDDTFALRWSKKIRLSDSLGGKCSECGNSNIFHLEFHHSTDEFEKLFKISSFAWTRLSLLEKEIKKCKLLCRNCHRELGCDISGRRHIQKRELLELVGKLKCEKCGYSGKNYSSLDFHHSGNKSFGVSDGLYSARGVIVSTKELIDEISKCVVLCGNCHILEHIDVEKFNRLKDLIMYKVENYQELQKEIDRDLILKMYNEGKGVCQIARELNCCKSTISMALKKLRSCGRVRLKATHC